MRQQFQLVGAIRRIGQIVSGGILTSVCAVVLVAIIGSEANAARPLVTEDAPVQARGECIVDSFWGRLSSRGDGSTRTLLSQVTCGIGSRTQLALGYSESRLLDASTRSVLVAGKTAIIETGEDGAGLSIAYGAPAERTPETPMRMGDVFATLAGTWPLTPRIMVHANLGWTGTHSDQKSILRWAVALEHAVRDDLALVAEAFADDHDRDPWLAAGVSHRLTPRISVNGSYGIQTRGAGKHAVSVGFVVGF